MDLINSSQNHHSDLWDRFAQDDPLFAILSEENRKGLKWDLVEFFQTGEDLLYPEIEEILGKYELKSKVRALDFGCGVGRLSRCLLRYFDVVYGIDVSKEMISLARELNPDAEKINFLDRSEPGLKEFKDATFDFVLSLIVVQHIPKKHIFDYLESLIRITRKDGLLFLQIPAKEIRYPGKPINSGNPHALKKLFRRTSRSIRTKWQSWKQQTGRFTKKGEPYFLMSCISPATLFRFFEGKGCKIIRLREDYSTGENFLSYDYLIRKLDHSDPIGTY